MHDGSSLLLSPLISLLALGLIVVICRWVFSTGNRNVPQPSVREDLGLLAPVTQVATRQEAELLRGLLSEAGVRAGVSEGPDGIRVLVFRKDLELARQLVSP